MEERNRLAEANLGLVGWVLRTRLHISPADRDWHDLLQEGYRVLLRAAELYDPEQGFEFTTYAAASIANRLIRVRRELSSGVIRLPVGLSADDLAEARERTLTTRLPGQGRDAEGSGLQADPRAVDPAEECRHAEMRDRIREALRRLPERFRRAVEMRLEGRTLEQVGEALGVSRQRVRQIEQEARERLRERCPDLERLLE